MQVVERNIIDRPPVITVRHVADNMAKWIALMAEVPLLPLEYILYQLTKCISPVRHVNAHRAYACKHAQHLFFAMPPAAMEGKPKRRAVPSQAFPKINS